MYSLNVCNHLSFITTMVPIASCVMGFWSLKHCRRRRKKKKEEIKTAAILYIHESRPALWVQPVVVQVTSLGYFKLALML